MAEMSFLLEGVVRGCRHVERQVTPGMKPLLLTSAAARSTLIGHPLPFAGTASGSGADTHTHATDKRCRAVEDANIIGYPLPVTPTPPQALARTNTHTLLSPLGIYTLGELADITRTYIS